MSYKNIGRIVQIVGAVLDVRFEDELPSLYNAIEVKHGEDTVVLEVMQHLGDSTVRCISMSPTDGLTRGMEAIDTGMPISVPVGEQTLGRMLNVLGGAIDNKPNPETKEHWPITESRPACRSRLQPRDFGTG